MVVNLRSELTERIAEHVLPALLQLLNLDRCRDCPCGLKNQPQAVLCYTLRSLSIRPLVPLPCRTRSADRCTVSNRLPEDKPSDLPNFPVMCLCCPILCLDGDCTVPPPSSSQSLPFIVPFVLLFFVIWRS